MKEKTVLVAGATGLVGEAIVRALAASLAVGTVAVVSRSERRLDELRARLGDVLAARTVPFRADAGDPGDALRLVGAVIERCGQIDVAVASLGAGLPDGRRLLEVDAASYVALMQEMLGSHVAFARAVLPRLAPGGCYLGIGGGAAFAPMPGGGVISMAAAAQVMMTRVLAAERARPDVSVRELVVDARVRAPGERQARGSLEAAEVAAVVEELVRVSRSDGRARAGTSDGPAQARISDEELARTIESEHRQLTVDGPILTLRPSSQSARSLSQQP